ncbi:PREDICTED: non-specific lipid-transfer protein 2-like [Tarenaya hassleriana]|uniref:non-specific lipid-transfer protein 2-like n=1 Tax=Tarenaya hassleriana TaxID=28532 RepID=UPI00053C2F30|nr:PREDICTED: non-specific lipid-transfer protein 2-like [Tarenaya hassleriana]
MKTAKWITVIALAAVLLLLRPAAEAVTCSPLELSPCAAAITSAKTPPSGQCCQKLREQKPCLCGYLKNPTLRSFVSSPNAKKVSTKCNLPFPNC